jgi:hypothetical protein
MLRRCGKSLEAKRESYWMRPLGFWVANRQPLTYCARDRVLFDLVLRVPE